MFQISLIWFGAAVSLAEILTGALLSSLGLTKGLSVIVLGHLIGGFLLFLAGYIGVRSKKGSMSSVAFSFGRYGSIFFSIMNIVQLVGWQGIMIFDAGISAEGIFPIGYKWWCLIVGILTIGWIVLGKFRNKLNIIVMSLLIVLTVVLTYVIIGGHNGAGLSAINSGAEKISFGQGLELSIAMPVSWIPMIADYTHKAEKPRKTAVLAVAVYSIASAWMYSIGLLAAIFTKETRVDQIMLKAGLGAAGLFIIVFSCITTNFIDAFSCNQSAFALLPENKKENSENKGKLRQNISKNIPGIVDTIIGTIGAVIFQMDKMSGFLYFIGSIFAPMISVQIADFFILRRNAEAKDDGKIDFIAILSWLAGFITYRILMRKDYLLGNTIPAMIITIIITSALRLLVVLVNNKRRSAVAA